MSGTRILVAQPFWVVAPWFRYVKGYSNRSGGVGKVVNHRSKVRLTQNTLQSSMFENMFSESSWLFFDVLKVQEPPGNDSE